MGTEELRQEPMMDHLLTSLDQGKDIGHYGRLVFAMISRHFMSDEEVLAYLTKDKSFSSEKAEAMLTQVKERDYNPPKRERILDWMRRQDFPLCTEPDDPSQCNVYRNLDFPKEVYDHINQFYQEKS